MKKIKVLFAASIFLFLASSIFAQSENSVAETKSTLEKAACSTSSCDSKAKETKVSNISNTSQVNVINAMDNKTTVKSEAGCCGSDSKVEGAKMSDSKKGSCNSSVTKTASVETAKAHNKECKCEGCVKS